MPRSRRPATFRHAMFIKAWHLDLAADVLNNGALRRSKQDQLCNAIAYYCFLKSIAHKSAEMTASPHLVKVDSSIDLSKIGAGMDRHADAVRQVMTLDTIIGDKVAKAIKAHFIEGQHIKVAGLCLQGLRHDPNAVGFAFQWEVQRAAKELFIKFNSYASDHEFHSDFIRSDSLGLFLKMNNRVRKFA